MGVLRADGGKTVNSARRGAPVLAKRVKTMASSEEAVKDAAGTPEEDAAVEAEVIEIAGENDEPQPEEVQEDPLAAAQRQAQEYLDLAQRTRADLENYRRRTLREQEDLRRYGSERVLRELLSAVDDAERALAHAAEDTGPLVEGFRLLEKNLKALLERNNVREAPGVGEPFNPDFHEAVQQIPSDDVEKGAVAVVFQKGYLLHDRLLRAAMVAVSSGKG